MNPELLHSGRARLIKDLRAQGISRNKAEKSVRAVFGLIADALAHGEEVEAPGGKLVVRTINRRPARRLWKFRKLDGKSAYRIAQYPGPHKTVRLKPTLNLD